MGISEAILGRAVLFCGVSIESFDWDIEDLLFLIALGVSRG